MVLLLQLLEGEINSYCNNNEQYFMPAIRLTLWA